MNGVLAELRSRLEEIWNLRRAAAVLGWDQQVNMPPEGGRARGEQSATPSRIAHARFTDAETGRLLDALEREAMGRGSGTRIGSAGSHAGSTSGTARFRPNWWSGVSGWDLRRSRLG